MYRWGDAYNRRLFRLGLMKRSTLFLFNLLLFSCYFFLTNLLIAVNASQAAKRAPAPPIKPAERSSWTAKAQPIHIGSFALMKLGAQDFTGSAKLSAKDSSASTMALSKKQISKPLSHKRRISSSRHSVASTNFAFVWHSRPRAGFKERPV